MKRLGLIGWLYVLALAPLMVGSGLFWYSYILREYYAIDGGIEVAAFFTILGYLLFGGIVVLMSIAAVGLSGKPWRKVVLPVAIVLLTLPMIQLYGLAHDSMTAKCYLRITKDVQVSHYWLWSDHFTQSVACDEVKANVISYTPVYAWNWDADGYSSGPRYVLSPVYLSIMLSNDSVQTFELPRLERRECQWLQLSEIMQSAPSSVQRKRFPRIEF